MSASALYRRCGTAGLFLSLTLLEISPSTAIPQEPLHDDGGVLPRNLQLPQDARIVGVQIQLNAGSFESVSNIPNGWHVVIENGAPQEATLEAHAESDVTALSGRQLLNISVQIRRTEPRAREKSTAGD